MGEIRRPTISQERREEIIDNVGIAAQRFQEIIKNRKTEKLLSETSKLAQELDENFRNKAIEGRSCGVALRKDAYPETFKARIFAFAGGDSNVLVLPAEGLVQGSSTYQSKAVSAIGEIAHFVLGRQPDQMRTSVILVEGVKHISSRPLEHGHTAVNDLLSGLALDGRKYPHIERNWPIVIGLGELDHEREEHVLSSGRLLYENTGRGFTTNLNDHFLMAEDGSAKPYEMPLYRNIGYSLVQASLNRGSE